MAETIKKKRTHDQVNDVISRTSDPCLEFEVSPLTKNFRRLSYVGVFFSVITSSRLVIDIERHS